MPTTRSRTIGGNPLRNLAIRQGKVPEPAPVHSPRPYTEADRKALLAPISIRSFGGKAWGGAVPNGHDSRITRRRWTDERYAQAADWHDIDNA